MTIEEEADSLINCRYAWGIFFVFVLMSRQANGRGYHAQGREKGIIRRLEFDFASKLYLFVSVSRIV